MLRQLRLPLTLLHVITAKGGDSMDEILESLLEALRLIVESLQEIATSIRLLEESVYKK